MNYLIVPKGVWLGRWRRGGGGGCCIMDSGELIASVVETALLDGDMWSVEEGQRTNVKFLWQPVNFNFLNLYYIR
jgi:hypothetical protein